MLTRALGLVPSLSLATDSELLAHIDEFRIPIYEKAV